VRDDYTRPNGIRLVIIIVLVFSIPAKLVAGVDVHSIIDIDYYDL
jgi:hypothetical protein